MQLCTIVFVENVSALKEELQVAIDIGSVKQLIWYFYLCLNSFLSYELLFYYPLLLLIICMRFNSRSIFLPLLDVL